MNYIRVFSKSILVENTVIRCLVGQNLIIYGLFNTINLKRSNNKKDVDINILYSAVSNSDSLRFNVLKSHFPNLTSMKEFLLSDYYVGDITLIIESTEERLSAKNYYETTLKALDMVARYVSGIKSQRNLKRKRFMRLLKIKAFILLTRMTMG